MKLTKTERSLLLLAPEVFAVLVLMEIPRPWTYPAAERAAKVWDKLPAQVAEDVFRFGVVLARVLVIIPVGVDYPDLPLRFMDEDDRAAWMRRINLAGRAAPPDPP